MSCELFSSPGVMARARVDHDPPERAQIMRHFLSRLGKPSRVSFGVQERKGGRAGGFFFDCRI